MRREVCILQLCALIALIVTGARDAGAEGAKPRVAGQSLVAPLLVDHQKEETAWVFPSADPSHFYIEAETLLNVTRKYLPAKTQAALEEAATPDRVVSVKALEDAGIQVNFDEAALDVHLTIPPGIRDRNEINLRPVTGGSVTAVGPAPYSGYLNVRGSQGFRFAEPSQGGNQKLPIAANLQLVNNFHGWGLETGADYQESASRRIRRADSRVVKDDESRDMRYTFGDLQLDTSGFQSVQSVGGFSGTRTFSIHPYTTTRPLNRTSVFLKRPSTVEIYVNGAFVQRLQLPAGPFDLQDYPLTAGRNDIELRVTDEVGQVETINVSLLFNNQLLAKGIQEFSYNVGFVSMPTQVDRQYDSSNVLASAYHRIGLTDRFTLGANVQRDRLRSLLGLEAYWATWAGMLIADAAASRDSPAIGGGAFRLRYQSLERWGKEDANTLLSANAEYDGNSFAAPGTASPTSVYAWKLDGFITEKLPWQLRVGAGYQCLFSRGDAPNRRIAQLDLSKNWSPTLQTGLNYSITSDVITENRLFASLSWSDPVNHRNNIQSTYDSANSASRVDWFRQPEKPYDDVRLTAGVQRDRSQDEMNARADYVGSRAEVTLDHQSTVPHQMTPVHATSLSLGSALVWTDKSIAVSRPVTESFVIVHDSSGSGVQVPINDNGLYSEAKVNGFGPAVLPGLISYYDQPVSIGVGALPEGYSVGREYIVARPTHKSGVDISLNVRASATASGRLLLPEGAPLALESGEVVRGADGDSAHEPGAFVSSFFTNSRGQYFVENLDPGFYELMFYDPRWKPVRIEIKKSQVGMVRLDPITVEKQ